MYEIIYINIYTYIDVDVFGKKGGGFPDQSMFLITLRYVILFNCLFGKLLFFFSKKLRTTPEPGYVWCLLL